MIRENITGDDNGFYIIVEKISFGFATSSVGTNVSFFVERAEHMQKSKFHVLMG